VELHQLGLPFLREAPSLVDLLAGELHEVLVHDVANVLEIADERDQPDLARRHVGAHGLAAEPGEEDLDLALEVVELIVAPLDLLQQLPIVSPQHLEGVAQHALGDVAHAQGLARGLAEGERRLVEVPVVEVAGLEGVVPPLPLRHQGGDGAGGERGEGQEQRADRDVEQGMGVGDLPRRLPRRLRDERGERVDEREHEGDAQDLERDVRHRDPARVRGGPHARREGGGAGADVGAQHHRDRASQREQPLVGEGQEHADGGRGRRHPRAERGSGEHAHGRIRGEGDQHLTSQGVLGHRGDAVRHQPHAEEQEAETQHRLAEALHEPAPAEVGQAEADGEQGERQVAQVEGEQLHGEGGADVRPQDHAQRLAEGHETGGHEPDQHEGGGGGRLDQRGHERARRHRGEAAARHAREEVAELAARRPLQALSGQLHPVEQDREAARQREQAHRPFLMATAAGTRRAAPPRRGDASSR
jgi:hypothetical protein